TFAEVVGVQEISLDRPSIKSQLRHGIVGSTSDMPMTTGEESHSASDFYPLRTNDNTAIWANLRALDSTGRKIASSHMPGGNRRPLMLVPHWGGRTRKEKPVDNPYTAQNPCLVKKLGAGPSILGFYRRPEHLQRGTVTTATDPDASELCAEIDSFLRGASISNNPVAGITKRLLSTARIQIHTDWYGHLLSHLLFQDEKGTQQSSRRTQCCLVDSLRSLGAKVPYLEDGPCSIRQGNVWLEKLRKSIRPSSWKELLQKPGKYILAYEQHFVSARHQEDEVLINMGGRTHEFESLQLMRQDRGIRRHPATGKLCVDNTRLDHVFELVDHVEQAVVADYSGGKLVEEAAVDFEEVWNQLQLQREETNDVILRHPQPQRIANDPNPDTVSNTDSEEDGFWDLRPDWLERFRARRQQSENRLLMPRQTDLSHKVQEYKGGAMTDELLAVLPGFYFSFDYLKMLASASKTMLRAVRDRRHWQDKLVTMNTDEFQLSWKLRWMMEAYLSARTVIINVRQLTMFTMFPRSMLLEWTATNILGGPRPAAAFPSMTGTGFESTGPLMGNAVFDIILPHNTVGMFIRDRDWCDLRYRTQAFCRLDSIFENAQASFGLGDLPSQPYLSTRTIRFQPETTHRISLCWHPRMFQISLDGVSIATARAREGAPAAPCALAKLSVWVYARPTPNFVLLQYRPALCSVDDNATIRCVICNREHGLHLPRWCVCPRCDTWVCSAHAIQMPARMCPRCPNQLINYVGGSSEMDEPYTNAVNYFYSKQFFHTPHNKHEAVVLKVMDDHLEFLTMYPLALELLPDPRYKSSMAKRLWERVMYRARAIIDFLTQKKHYMLFLFLHAESRRSGTGSRDNLQHLPHPNDFHGAEHDWAMLALVHAVEIHVDLAWQQKQSSFAAAAMAKPSAPGQVAWQDVSGGSVVSQLEFFWQNDMTFTAFANEAWKDFSGGATQTHRSTENLLLSAQELRAMPMEAIFNISHYDGSVERLTEGSGGSHLSADTAAYSENLDVAGGATNNRPGPVLFPELLRFLPAYYFCPEYLATLAACSRTMKQQVLDRNHWIGCHLDLERPELLRDQQALRAMSRWWMTARTVNLSQHQLTQLDTVPQNCLLRWKAFDFPSQDDRSEGYRAVHSLLGSARFRVILPDHVRTLRIGVENPNGPEAVSMNIHELFTERMCMSFCLVPLQRARGSRYVPLSREVLQPRASNEVMLMWDRRFFAVNLNGFNLGPVRLDLDAAPGPPSQALPFIWTVSARRAPRNEEVAITPLLSPVMPGAECLCRICCNHNSSNDGWLGLACVQAPRLLLDLVPQDFAILPAAQPDCSLLSCMHEHDRDKRISFLSETHVYYVDGVPMSISVTGLVHKFAETFDADVASANMQRSSRWPRPEYSSVQSDGVLLPMTAAEIKHMWLRNATDAAHRGTWMHLQIEVLMNGGFVAGHWPELKLFGAQFGRMHRLRGRASDNSLVLFDWKRTRNLRTKYTNKFRNMKLPLSHIPDCAGWHYRLQLNTYKYILERYYGYVVSAMYVVCLHPDNMETGPFIDEVPNMSHDVAALLTANADGKDVPWQDVSGGSDPDAGASQTSFNARLDAELAEMDVAESPFDRPTQENEALALALNEHGSDYQNSLALAIPSRDLPADAVSNAKKRRMMPGASKSCADFESLFDLTAKSCSASLSTCPTVEEHLPVGSVKEHAKRLIEYIRVRQPTWPEDMVRLAASAINVYRTRLTDIFVRDFVSLIWIIEGGRYIRAHRGVCYLYHTDGAFDPYNGVPPESTFFRLKKSLLRLEGLFRRMSPATDRSDAAIHREIVRLLSECNNVREFLESCEDTAVMADTTAMRRRGRAEQEAEAAPSAGWPEKTAYMLAKVLAPLQKDLLEERRLLHFVIQWCDTPSERQAGCAYQDISVVYDVSSTEHVKLLRPSPENNLYVRIPHPLQPHLPDPVLHDAKLRLEKFVKQTFWCNQQYYKATLAAIGLAKRGENIDRCFIGESAGGTGQSLFSSHLAAVYSQNHAFIDPNLFHNEEEMRKQLEQFAHCWIITAQEAPETHRHFQQDLYKKFMSADDLAGRKPYGFVAKMMRVTGFKRFETNKIMTFRNVMETNFNSIYRRCLVWKPQPIFVDSTSFGDAYKDPDADGIFQKDPTLRSFLESGPAIAAALIQQHGFESHYSRQECVQMIEDYALSGFTERKVREACGLRPPEEPTAMNPHGNLAAILKRNEDDSAQGEILTTPVEKANAAAVKFFMKNEKASVSKAWWLRFAKAKLGCDKDIFDDLVASNIFLPVDPKSEPENFIPTIPCAKYFEDVFTVGYESEATVVRERLNARKLWDAVERNAARSANAELLVHFFYEVLSRYKLQHVRTRRYGDTLKLPMSEGKLLLQKVLNGGSPPQQLANNTFVQELQQASLFCRWAAATMLKDTAWPSLVEMKERPDVSVLTYFWNIAEDLVLDAWLRKVKSLQSKHTSLHFDGIRVDKDIAQPDVEAFCTSCSDAILEETGLVVHIRAKERYTFHALLTQVSDSKAAECPENLREPGNLKSGQKVLLHLATDGNPHCLAMEVLPGEQVRVTDVNASYTFSVQRLLCMLSEATDRKYIIFFHVNQKPAKNERDAKDKEYDLLLDTLAGGNEREHDEFVKDLELPFVDEKGEDDDSIEDDESVTRVGDKLLAALRNEVAAFLNMEPAQVASQVKKNGRALCPFCPRRSWETCRPGRVLEHVRQYHSERKQFVASGTKQLKIIIALHDHDQCRRQPLSDYLRRSACLLAASLDETISTKHMLIDKEIRLVFTSDGPQYWSLAAVQQAELRRVRNLYYTRAFGQLVFREMLMCSAKAGVSKYTSVCVVVTQRSLLMRCSTKEYRQFAVQVYALHARLLATFPGEINSLLPRHVNHWWPLVEDLFLSPRITSLEQELKAELVLHEEFEFVSMDATLRCCLPVMGQAHPRASREEKVVTCRGRTNAVLMLCATTTDEADVLVEAMATNLPASGLRQVRCVSVDNPSSRLWQSLRLICPNLQVLALDPIHLAMTCEYASSRKRTALTKTLRLILRKLTVHSPHCTDNTWGPVFRGDNCKALTREEEKARSQIEDRSMPLRKATALLENLDGSVPFFEGCEWTQALAAVAAVYRDDMDRVVPGPNRKVFQLLHSAAAAARTEWYLNNLRARHTSSKEMWTYEQWREWCEQLQGNARIEKASLQLHPQREEERAKVKEGHRLAGNKARVTFLWKKFCLDKVNPQFTGRRAGKTGSQRKAKTSAPSPPTVPETVGARWKECSSHAPGIPTDWLGRQLLQVTPEIFDEALGHVPNKESDLHANIGKAIERLEGRYKPPCRLLSDISPEERLSGKVVRVDALKAGKLVRLEYSLGGPTLLITAFAQMDEVHPVGAMRHFSVGWRWHYQDRCYSPTARYLSEG
ncbi:unnamed protein product, partial [Symbiodinium microadriaticum]